jgi:hypothetical protein
MNASDFYPTLAWSMSAALGRGWAMGLAGQEAA